ncbi:hypothetical protein B0H14DRAFT_3482063 [Mycena olivaceomarginata]|nr:hypothetical protein B0H14DRAFT_3482063 [Mycena olivaceomarginata]
MTTINDCRPENCTCEFPQPCLNHPRYGAEFTHIRAPETPATCAAELAYLHRRTQCAGGLVRRAGGATASTPAEFKPIARYQHSKALRRLMSYRGDLHQAVYVENIRLYPRANPARPAIAFSSPNPATLRLVLVA